MSKKIKATRIIPHAINATMASAMVAGIIVGAVGAMKQNIEKAKTMADLKKSQADNGNFMDQLKQMQEQNPEAKIEPAKANELAQKVEEAKQASILEASQPKISAEEKAIADEKSRQLDSLLDYLKSHQTQNPISVADMLGATSDATLATTPHIASHTEDHSATSRTVGLTSDQLLQRQIDAKFANPDTDITTLTGNELTLAKSIPTVVSVSEASLIPTTDVIDPARFEKLLSDNGKQSTVVITKIDKVYTSQDDRAALYKVTFSFDGNTVVKTIQVNYSRSQNEQTLANLDENKVSINQAKVSGAAPAFANKNDFFTTVDGLEIVNVAFANGDLSTNDVKYSIDLKLGSATKTIIKTVHYAKPFIADEFKNLPANIFSFFQVTQGNPLTIERIKSLLHPNLVKAITIGNIVDKYAAGE